MAINKKKIYPSLSGAHSSSAPEPSPPLVKAPINGDGSNLATTAEN